LIVVRFL